MKSLEAIVVSPVSPFGLQGNSVRVRYQVALLRKMGYRVHFIFANQDAIDKSTLIKTSQFVDKLYFIEDSHRLKRRSSRRSYHPDDWYDGRISIVTERILAKHDVSLILANYIWNSRLFDDLDFKGHKLLDTHDRFGNREQNFREQKEVPEWFFCSEEDEKSAIERSDITIAITDVEERYFRDLSNGARTRVFCLGLRFAKPENLPKAKKFRFGYLGSANPTNSQSIKDLSKKLERSATPIQLHLYGPISNKLEGSSSAIVCNGSVKNISEFYSNIGCSLNADMHGTGLKIKSVEAICFGVPIISTAGGFSGIESPYRFHQFSTLDEMAEYISDFNKALIDELTQATEIVGAEYVSNVIEMEKELEKLLN